MTPSPTGSGLLRATLLSIALGLTFTTSGALANDATPVAEPAWGCDVPPRSRDEIAALLATPAAPEPQRSGLLPMGEPLRPEEQIALETAVHRFIACGNTGEWLRISGLFTDRYLLRLLSGERPPFGDGWSDPPATPHPTDPGSAAELVEITGGRRMADGRLGALVTIAFPDTPPTTFFFTFQLEGDRALIDDISAVSSA